MEKLYAILAIIVISFVALKYIGGPLTWVGRQIMILLWKRDKQWPIKVEYRGEDPPTVARSGFYQATVSVYIEVRKKKADSKIDSVEMILSSSEHTHSGYEGGTTLDSSPLRLTNGELSALPSGVYIVQFTFPTVSPNANIPWRAIIRISAEGMSCEARVGNVRIIE